MMRRLLATTAAALLTVASAGCGAKASGFSSDGRLDVVTAFYPLQFLSERIGAEAVTVTQLTKPGAEPHDVELNPRQVADISDAGLVVYLKGFQPAVDEAVAQEATDRALDVGSAVPLLAAAEEDDEHVPGEPEHAEGATDPHVWLDPVRFATIADRLAERLAQADPARAAGYTERAKTLHTELTALDAEYSAALRTCARRELVTSHTAFRYLAARYDLTEVGITGISPESEPSPQRLAQVAEQARATGTTTIFFETLVSPKVAETIAREVGAKTAVLDPLEGLSEPGTDYFSVMRSNLTALTTALGCPS
ncbi:metal ABC transporter substrate-binding protein [Actinoplanes sp. NPDC049599]|uniref:metal ABC transporter substrate-binding protein n=1 Tax=Actinoplanes sp. NPDC049599 TaxID=3363903 RepID=UPI0037BB8274